jgi:hypothetical protein
MSILWYPTPKQSPILGSLGLGGGIGSNLVSGGGLIPGSISGSYSSNSDSYSGGAIVGSPDCGITPAVSNFDARPPSQSQVDDIMDVWMNCKSYSTDGVDPDSGGYGVFWGRDGNSLTITFSGFQANQDMATYLYTSSTRPITFSGLITGTETSVQNDYKYFNVNSSGGGTLTYDFDPTGDPPYVYWVGPRYNDPGY